MTVTTFPTKSRGPRVNGVTFPQLFRVIGYDFKRAGNDLLVRGDNKVVSYTLSETDLRGLCEPVHTPIDRLDPAIDTGWVLIRQHLTVAGAHGYCDALVDFVERHADIAAAFFSGTFGFGLFTIAHRQARAGCPDLLIHYDDAGCSGRDGSIVIDSDGNRHTDEIMWPEEEVDA